MKTCRTVTIPKLLCLAVVATFSHPPVGAAEVDAPAGVRLADGALQLTPPAAWTAKKPKFAGIIDYEFSVPAAEGDTTGARVVIGGAGGGIEANQQRWLRQFTQPDGARTADRAERSEQTIAGTAVTTLDVSGTYNAPPFDPGGGGARPNYRLRVAVINAGPRGAYYVKLYGPRKTVAAAEDAFDGMIDSLRVGR